MDEPHLDDVAALSRPLDAEADLDPLLDRIGDARFVLLGEASHGTAEYYVWRAALTRRLIAERGFSLVAVEGDWPDCRRVTRWLRGEAHEGASAAEVLRAFDRWPTWMWANVEVAGFLTWLRDHDEGLPPDERVGFHGLDVYSLWDSMRAVIDYLGEHDPGEVDHAIAAFRCFEPYGEDPQGYAWATRLVPTSCEQEVVELLGRLCQEGRASAAAAPGDADARFDAEQNAAVAAGAERYYRAMVRGGGESWNVRDTHMADTLDRLVDHHGPGAKAVVWAHNTHVGDARATDMAAAGMVNLGQLVRERHGDAGVVVVGFGGHHGHVIAAPAWGAPLERMPVPPARPGSLEDLLHRAGRHRSLLVFPEHERPAWTTRRWGHRAIGVVYHPAQEREGNYVPTVPADRYDAFCSFTETTALHPLHLDLAVEQGERETEP